MALNDLLQRHLERPVRAFVRGLQEKARHVTDVIDDPALLDQYPGRRVPFHFTRIYRIDGTVTARRDTRDHILGHELLAPVADPSKYILPREGPIRVGRFGTWRFVQASHTVYTSLTYAAEPDAGLLPVRVIPQNGDIFDTVVETNGGGLWAGNRAFTPIEDAAERPNAQPTFAFRLGLYDKLRGAYLHDGNNLPLHFCSGQLFGNREQASSVHFDANTEIEPRLFIDEIRWSNLLDTDEAYGAARPRAYFILTLLGFLEQDDNEPSDVERLR